MTQLLLIAVGIVVLVMLIRSFRPKKADEEAVEEEPVFSESGLDDIDTGGVLSILGTDYVVEERNRYTAAGSEWHEVKLTGDANETWWLAWEDSDDVTLTSEVAFAGLGVSPEGLETIADEGQGDIEYEGDVYTLSEASEATYYRGGSSQGETLYYWDFHDADEERVVGVVLWSSRTYNAYIGSLIPRSQVEILRNADGDD